MSEKPILFSGPMVLAIIAGRKTQTRRIMKPQPVWTAGEKLWVKEGLRNTAGFVAYQADDTMPGNRTTPWRWAKKTLPSMFCPRWASRITLTVTAVRCERLQAISEADAIAEGAQCAGFPASLTNRGAFAKLWDKINGKKHPWESDPWVWVIEFERSK